MSKVNSSSKRCSNPSRKVDDKLPLELRRQLTLDFDKHSGDSWKQFAARKLRTEYYVGPLVGAAQNRFTYLKKLKAHNPEKYWPIVVKATSGPSSKNCEAKLEDSPDEFGGDSESESELSDNEDTGNKTDTPQKFTTPPTTGIKKKTKSPSPRLTLSFPSPPSRSDLKMAPRAPPSASSTSRTGQGPATYGSMDEAELDADFVIKVDFDQPEKNGAPLFWLQEIAKVKSDDGKVLIWKAKILINNVMDLRDFELTKGTVVCEGLGFLVKLPALPFFRRNEKSINDFHSTKEAVRCTRTEEDFLGAALSIASDKERLMIKYLFVMPDDYVVSADMNSERAPTCDQKCKLKVREYTEKYETPGKAGAAMKKWQQTWYPGFWMLRIVSKGTSPLQTQANDSDDDLEDGFAGMKI